MPPSDQVIALFLFAVLIGAATLQGLAASGHFPRRGDGAKSAIHPGPPVLYGSIAVAFLALIAGSTAALRLTSWSAAVIAGGLALLFAPLLLRVFPDRFVDGAGALIAFTAAALAAAAVLIWLAT